MSNGKNLATKRNWERKSVDMTSKLVPSTKVIVGFTLQHKRRRSSVARCHVAEKRTPRWTGRWRGRALKMRMLGTQLRLHSRCLLYFRERPPTAVSSPCSSGGSLHSPASLVSHFPRHFLMEVVNPNPTFGSSLLNDNFARQDDMKALDPLKLEAAQGAMAGDDRASEEAATHWPAGQADSLLLQHPDGATQRFNPVGAEDAESAQDGQEAKDGRNGMRHLAGRVTVGAERTGVTDWHAGTDGGRSSKPRVGVPYGSFAGV